MVDGGWSLETNPGTRKDEGSLDGAVEKTKSNVLWVQGAVEHDEVDCYHGSCE